LAKIVVIGAPGSGKTTFARALAQKLRVEYIELDALLHGRGGIEPSDDEFRAAVLPTLDREAWVVDGWHERKLGTLVLERADVAVLLDPALPVIIGRLLRRTLPEILRRKELWNGNRQTWRGAFGGQASLFGYTLRRHGDIRRRVRQLQNGDELLAQLEWVHLARARDVRDWLSKRTA
jgi:energy-coupling factor transporter ATP-binding protein EcfA2